jgi:lipoprotein-anchoring transpeptidase ErfK/SrfK
MNMLKKAVQLSILICTFGMYCIGEISLADDLNVVVPSLSNNSVTKPTNYIDNLINQPLKIQISLSRRQLTTYRGNTQIKSYPIAVGRRGWETPTGNFQVLEMLEKPTWINPFTGKAISGGLPENPLGHYWIGFWTDGRNWIGFHGTPNPESVGKAASHGCVRMYDKDIKELFHQVSVGTSVTVVR